MDKDLLLLSYCPSLRESWLFKLTEAGLTIEEVVHMTSDQARAWGLTSEMYSKFNQERNDFNLDKAQTELKKLGLNFITGEDTCWPTSLNNLNPAPLWLFVRGNLEALQAENIIGFVGTRKLSPYGQLVSKNVANWLTKGGATLVSGLAFGADAIAHQAAVASHLPTIAILASSADEASLYPQSHVPLARKIIENNGALVSEWPPYFHPQQYHFPYRNRLIAGLSKALVITEAPIKSGTLHTAKWALELGLPIGAVPGDINRESSSGTNYLISAGATALCNKEDVLQFAGLEMPNETDQLSLDNEDLSDLAKKIWHNLTEPKNFDQLTTDLGLPSAEILGALTELEINDKISRLSTNDFSRKF